MSDELDRQLRKLHDERFQHYGAALSLICEYGCDEMYALEDAARIGAEFARAEALEEAAEAVLADTRAETVQSNWTLKELGADIAERVIRALVHKPGTGEP